MLGQPIQDGKAEKKNGVLVRQREGCQQNALASPEAISELKSWVRVR